MNPYDEYYCFFLAYSMMRESMIPTMAKIKTRIVNGAMSIGESTDVTSVGSGVGEGVGSGAKKVSRRCAGGSCPCCLHQ